MSTITAKAPDRAARRGRRGGASTWAGQAGWAGAVGGTALVFALGLPAQYRRFVSLHGPEPLGGIAAATRARLEASGWTVREYAAAALVLDVLLALGFAALALVVARHAGAGRWRRVFALAMLAFGCTFGLVPDALASAHPAWRAPVALLTVVALAGSVVVLTLFPDGRIHGWWTLAVPAVYTVWLTGRQIHGVRDQLASSGPAMTVLVVASIVLGQGLRYRHATPHERDQLRWAAAGIAGGLVGFVLAGYVVPAALGSAARPGSTGALLLTAALFGSLLLIPAGMAVALVHARLWDVDLALNRALVYAILTLLVGAVYAALVWSAAQLGRAGGIGVMVVVSLGVTVALHPARRLVQREVNRLMYGDRDHPLAVLAGLGRSLAERIGPEQVLTAIATAVHDGLRVPYARVAIDSVQETSAAVGVPGPEALCLPIHHRGEQVGELAVASRRGGRLGRRDARFLREVVALSGPAVAAVRLTRDLQLSRERLVVAREEERKRIRDDLHDGIGPALASVALQAAALRRGRTADSDLAAPLARLQADTNTVVREIRTLVRGLRPPLLDDQGLLAAIDDLAATVRAAGVVSEVDVTLVPAVRPAAIEVAIYRIAQEACANVLRHAHAQRCRMALAEEGDWLVLTVADDGVGIPSDHVRGVGMTSMHERAAELGGECGIGPGRSGGTVVRARLPRGGVDG